jgi:hypothetical protein
MTVGGVVKHLAWAEDRWFVGKMLGEPLPEPWASAPLDTEPDWPFESAANDPPERLLDLYELACDRSREVVSRFHDLGQLAAKASFGAGPANLRFMLVNMLNETAWHLGHIDILCDALRAQRG